MKIIILLLSFSIFISCTRTNVNNTPSGMVTAFVPVYTTITDAQAIAIAPTQATINAGKVYAYNNYIYQNDLQKGFHIIKNIGANNHQKIAFLKVPYSTEIAIKGNFLYCNNVSDLVVFNITNPENPILIKRVNDAFPVINQTHPPVSNGYFECADNSKGIIVNWEQKIINTPNCKR